LLERNVSVSVKKQTDWAGGFREGDSVSYNWRKAHVIALPAYIVYRESRDHVPVVDDESRRRVILHFSKISRLH